ncbi:MAG: helicase-associated domain-containing protein [Isosphaeraceae bacterium]
MSHGRESSDQPAAGKADSLIELALDRKRLADWDARWHRLSPSARETFLDVMRGPSRTQSDHAPSSFVSASRIPPSILDELTKARFARVLEPHIGARVRRVIAPAELYDFAQRVRTLRCLSPLSKGPSASLLQFINRVFNGEKLVRILADVMTPTGIHDITRLDLTVERYIASYRWPEWVASKLKDPLANQALELVQESNRPIPLLELVQRVDRANLLAARAAVDRLIVRLALFEDLDPSTCEIVVGLLPAVREGKRQADSASRRGRPALSICEKPRELGPDDSPIVEDLRAVLLEITAEPPRVRQNGLLFQKEIRRFLSALLPMPAWLIRFLAWNDEERLGQAMAWARNLELVHETAEGTEVRIRLSPKGETWLASGLDRQYAQIYALATEPPRQYGYETGFRRLFTAGPAGPWSGYVTDLTFLGEDFVARPDQAKTTHVSYWSIRPADMLELRKHLDRAMSTLKPDLFHRLESIAAHLAFGPDNPLNLGLGADPTQVAVFLAGHPIPPLPEKREASGRTLIESFIRRRLIPLGCVRTAVDDEGKICVARRPRLDAYFGREVPPSEMAPTADGAARVVVQPDFSVIVIGPNPAAAAELAPFCERSTGGAGHGAMILKLTRDSVVKAVGHGLKPDEVVARLRRHASVEVPANVLHEVKQWSTWVRRITPTTLTVLRCPDRETADRVMSALRKQAERLNDTMVALDAKKLTPADRSRLVAQGIVVEAPVGAGAERKSAAKRKKKGRTGW